MTKPHITEVQDDQMDDELAPHVTELMARFNQYANEAKLTPLQIVFAAVKVAAQLVGGYVRSEGEWIPSNHGAINIPASALITFAKFVEKFAPTLVTMSFQVVQQPAPPTTRRSRGGTVAHD